MKRLFISQPMRGMTDEQILLERERAITRAKELIGEDVKVIDSFITGVAFEGEHPLNSLIKSEPLFLLAESLRMLSTADIMYCVPGYEKARGCRIEKLCALEYKIPILEEH